MLNRIWAFCLILATGIPVTAGVAEPAGRHVILISVDGFPADLLHDKNTPIPTIRELAAQGAAAEGMIVSNPSVTWPNHTSLITGVRPEKHGVLFNGRLERGGLGLPVRVDPRKDRSELVSVPTLYDHLHEAGLTTAGVNWPCTRNTATLDFDFPDVPEMLDYTTPQLLQELEQQKILPDELRKQWNSLGTVRRDEIWTETACHLIRTRQPNFLMLHLLNVDSTHHKYGPHTPAGQTALAYADACIRRVVDAVEQAGLRERTTFFIVSDHGFIAIPKTLQPNVLLRQHGLLQVEGNTVTQARVHAVPEGGIAMVYLTVPDQPQRDRQKVREIFSGQEGIAGIIEPAEYRTYGLPSPRENRQMADLILVAKDGYGFNGTATGEDFVIDSTSTVGAHGFLSTNPKMNANFIASGAGIRRGSSPGIVENIDVAATIAHLFGMPLDGADGRVLAEILKPK